MAAPARPPERQKAPDKKTKRSGMSGLRAWLRAGATLLVILAIGSLFTPGEWYDTIAKPTWQPPAWVFSPVWITLYLLLTVGLALLLQAPSSSDRTIALRWYFAHLFLNVTWSPLFFGAHAPGWAFANICVQWLALALSILAGFRVRKWVGWLQFPTFLWVSFALVLNGVIVALNL